eukprot:TRINITY_DN21871_c0_g1_i1.p2 TRINITY_DN21871_c0_g1~~TRINITY_DN21871_c0_g1_i1.p2  ORF type:complete len:162 (+),score=56.06 TRINITY_DN21871_c0_g1_i1:100-585(+)
MAGADIHHPALPYYVPQKHPNVDASSVGCRPAGATQEPLGIELPNPNLAAYQNTLVGEVVYYPVNLPSVAKKSEVTAKPSFYQRATRRPWDLSFQQFSSTINKRRSMQFLAIVTLIWGIFPAIPREKHVVDTGIRRPPFNLQPSDGIWLPGPQRDDSYAGN